MPFRRDPITPTGFNTWRPTPGTNADVWFWAVIVTLHELFLVSMNVLGLPGRDFL